MAAAEALGANHDEHIVDYGHRIEGAFDRSPRDLLLQGVQVRGVGPGASVRIPWQVYRDGKGYIEDRRPNAKL